MERVLAGYYIGHDIRFELEHRKLSSIKFKGQEYILRDTMMRLFVYLLKNANGGIVCNEDILFHVWDQHGLKSSSQRLWQVMQQLKIKMIALGAPHDFIMRVEGFNGKGYTLKSDLIRPYYFICEKTNKE
ncbi:winged helix-turn-helix domain-containing protein [Gibbsiella dentisursi]|uniref:Winged helix-turn-helix domain-containing protein n=1 Tax=Gibbsiella dentisursi TaxID=796890 RepID=A0ABP7KR14_9GAMM